jgi:hypothetical protein
MTCIWQAISRSTNAWCFGRTVFQSPKRSACWRTPFLPIHSWETLSMTSTPPGFRCSARSIAFTNVSGDWSPSSRLMSE